MSKLTKADIDALVDGMRPSRIWPDAVKLDARDGGWIKDREALKTEMYLAAGLTASGGFPPEQVRCWMWEARGKPRSIFIKESNCHPCSDERIIPGTFIPDDVA